MYIIVCDVNSGCGIVRYTLTQQNEFVLATSDGRQFRSILHARGWWVQHSYTIADNPSFPPGTLNKRYRIVGPNGGEYRIT